MSEQFPTTIPPGYRPLTPSEYMAARRSVRVLASFYLQREHAVLEKLKARLHDRICQLDGEAAALKAECDDLRGLVKRLRREKAAMDRELHLLHYEQLIEDTEQPARSRPSGLLHPAPEPSKAIGGHNHPLSA